MSELGRTADICTREHALFMALPYPAEKGWGRFASLKLVAKAFCLNHVGR